jgi:hypothetical protein
MMRIVFFSFALFSVSVLSACGGDSDAPALPSSESQFVVLADQTSVKSGVLSTTKQNKVITTQADYSTTLAIYSTLAAQPLDFTKGKVLLVDAGTKSTGGYSVRVTSVDVFDTKVVANAEFVQPGPKCLLEQSITNPYQFVFIPTLKDIEVSEKVSVTQC